MANEMSVDVNDLWGEVTFVVKLKGMTRWQIRTWIMRQLIYLAAYIGGCKVRMLGEFATSNQIEELDG